MGGLRSVHVVAGLDVSHGGPSYSVPRLCRSLQAAGAEPTLLSVVGKDAASDRSSATDYRDRRFRQAHANTPVLRALRLSPALRQALREIAPASDVLHNHGLWLLPNVEVGWASAKARKPLVVSTRGMLSPAALAFSATRKRLFWILLQGRVLRRAACLHATSIQEYEEIRAFGLVNPVAVVPNGIDLPQFFEPKTDRPERIVLSLGRLHPKKGLDRLVRAWAEIEPRYPEWRLRIVGPDEAGYAVQLKNLVQSLALERVSIEGPLYGEAKWKACRSAELFVLPSLNENFGLAVAEALAAATPAISTRGAPWRGLETEGCGWWIEQGAAPLSAALAEAMLMPRARLRELGEKGRSWMARDFSWDRAAGEMLAVYRWVAGLSGPPATARFA